MAEYDAGTVKATMTADSSGLHGGVQSVKKDMRSLQDEAKKVKDSWRDMGVAAGVSFTAITAGVWKATQANNQLKSSMMGLDSIAKGTVGSYQKIEAELEKVREDGMIPLNNAISAYKNLLMRYEDEETAITMFRRIADAAAYGRQAHLSLGEAIQGTTEGLKNENSQMTDNGGITKNLSVMWKDYAISIGKTVGQLTEAEKHQAEINGFMEEGKHQVGDLAKLQNTLAGEMSKANAMTKETSAAFGNALEPATTDVVGSFSSLMKGIKDFIQASPGMVAGITTGALAMTGLVTATSAWIVLDIGTKIAAGFTALTGPVGLTMIALSALAAVVVGLRTEAEKYREEQKKLVDHFKAEANELDGLIDEYEKLSKKTNKTAEEKERLRDVSKQIAKMVPDSVIAYDKEAGAIINLDNAVKGLVKTKTQELRARQNSLGLDYAEELKNQRKLQEQMDVIIEDFNQQKSTLLDSLGDGNITQSQYEQMLSRVSLEYEQGITSLQDQIDVSKQIISEIETEKNEIDQIMKDGVTRDTVKKDFKKTNSKAGDNSLAAAAKKRADEQSQLQNQLYIEMLERQKRFKEAEIKEEELRFAEELELAKGNNELTVQVKQANVDRIAAINKKYLDEDTALYNEWAQKAGDVAKTETDRQLADIEREREAKKTAATETIEDQDKLNETLANIDKVYDDQRLQTITEALSDEYKLKEKMTADELRLIKQVLEAKLAALEADETANEEQLLAYKKVIEEVSKNIDIETNKTNAQIKENTADLLADLVTKKKTIEDVWKDLMDELVRQYIKKFIFGIEGQSGNLTKIFDSLFSNKSGGNSSSSSTTEGIMGVIGAILSFSKGGTVPAAANGMVVPDLPPSFGTDKVISALTPKEMVLPQDISEGLQGMIRQGGQSQNITNNVTNNYIDAIDQQSVAQFFYKNRDQVVGIVQDNQRRGGVLRPSEE